MDITLIIFIFVILVFAVRGYRSGFLKVATKLAGYLIAYGVAYSYAKPVSLILQSNFPVNGLVSYLIAGILLFIFATIISSVIFNFLIKLLYEEKSAGKGSSIGGGLLGGGIGILFGFLFVWFFSTFEELNNAKKGLPAVAQSQFQLTIKNLTTQAIKSIVSQISNNPDISAISSAIITNPVENIERYKRITNNGEFRNVFENESSKKALNNLNPNQLMQSEPFKKLVTDPDFIALTKEFNLPTETTAMQKDVAVKLTTVWAQIHQVKNDPQFIAIIEDPEVKQQIQDKNILTLLNNSKVDELISLITSAKIPQLNFDTTNPEPSLANEPAKKVEAKTVSIYKWIDKNGKVHYSDKPKGD